MFVRTNWLECPNKHPENCIRTISQTFNHRLNVRHSSKLYKRLFRSHTKRSRRRAVRYSLLTANICLLVAAIAFVSQQPSSNASQALLSQPETAAASPLDQLSSADIAVHVSRMVQMDVDEVTQVANQADSESAQLAVSSADSVVVAKPQLVNTQTKSAKDIKTYVAVAGDSVDSLAAKFGVTSDSIKGSNGLSGNTVRVGTQLYIPPVNGIVYVVKAGDTAASLASRFGGNQDSIIADNDAEVSGLRVGTRILIRDGVFRAAAGRTAAPATNYTYAGFSFGTSAIYGYNGYTRGYCTWYVASRISVPSNWGNANTWDDRARLSGWTVSSNPRAGAIGQTNVGYAGHVGIVEAVSEDGSMIKYSDMNGIAGYNRVGYSDWVPARSVFQNFIYR